MLQRPSRITVRVRVREWACLRRSRWSAQNVSEPADIIEHMFASEHIDAEVASGARDARHDPPTAVLDGPCDPAIDPAIDPTFDPEWETMKASFQPIHPHLDQISPGPELAAFLSGIDVASVSPHDRVVVLQARRRMVSHLEAAVMRDMASILEAIRDGSALADSRAAEGASAEISAALQMTGRAADADLALAMELTTRHSVVLDMVSEGRIDMRRARVIVSSTEHLDDVHAATVVDAIANDVAHLTTSQIRSRISRLCFDLDTDDATDRYEASLEHRRVASYPLESGTALISATDLAPHRVEAAMGNIDRLARSLRGGDESRSMDQLRADVFLDLLMGIGPDGSRRIPASIDIVVDLDTLIGHSDRSADLGGFGPVVADIARQLAAEHGSQWRYTIIDPTTRVPIATGITRRRPNAKQRRSVHARYRTCVFPGCRTPAHRADLDHRIAWAGGGPTSEANLAPLCRKHHRVKHEHDWTYRPTGPIDHTWQSGLGHAYRTRGSPA